MVGNKVRYTDWDFKTKRISQIGKQKCRQKLVKQLGHQIGVKEWEGSVKEELEIGKKEGNT